MTPGRAILVYGWVALCLLTAAQEGSPQRSPEVPPDLEISPWDLSFDLRGAFGYKDNVALSHQTPEASPSWLTGLDITLFRLPTNGFELSFMFVGDDTRYLRSEQVPKEQTFFALAELKQELSPAWEAGFSVQYAYQDQLFDASGTDVGLGIVEAQGHGFTLRPSVHHLLGRSTWLEFEFPVTRQYFIAPLDDYWEGGPKLILRHQYGYRSDLALSYQVGPRWYDNRTQVTLDAQEMPGTSLDFMTQRAEWAWRHSFDAQRHWRSTWRIGAELTRDNGPGYFNYNRYYGAQQLRFNTGPWTAKAEVSVHVYEYQHQALSATDPSLRNKVGLTFNCRLERALTQKLKLYCEFEHERSLSNQVLDEYVVNTVSSGFDFEF